MTREIRFQKSVRFLSYSSKLLKSMFFPSNSQFCHLGSRAAAATRHNQHMAGRYSFCGWNDQWAGASGKIWHATKSMLLGVPAMVFRCSNIWKCLSGPESAMPHLCSSVDRRGKSVTNFPAASVPSAFAPARRRTCPLWSGFFTKAMVEYESPVAQPGAVGTYSGCSPARGWRLRINSDREPLSNSNRKSSWSLNSENHGSERGLPRKMKSLSDFKSVN
jgi:hypothetical protein